MALLAFLFRLVLFLLVFRLAGIVLKSFFGGVLRGSRPAGPSDGGRGTNGRSDPKPRGQVEELVKDPVCGVHTAKSSAVVGRYQGSPAYFCSEECAEKAKTTWRPSDA